MKNSKLLLFLLSTTLFSAQPGISQTADPDAAAFQSGARTGVSFKILRLGEEGYDLVGQDYPFVTGDRFRLVIRLNRPGFVYILNRTLAGDPDREVKRGIFVLRDEDRADPGQENSWRLIYPVADHQPVAVEATHAQSLPASDAETFIMDSDPGVEKLMVLVSPAPLDITADFDLATGRMRSRNDNPASPDDSNPAGSGDARAIDRVNAALTGGASNTREKLYPGSTRGVGVAVSGYALAIDPSRPLMAEITLLHYDQPR